MFVSDCSFQARSERIRVRNERLQREAEAAAAAAAAQAAGLDGPTPGTGAAVGESGSRPGSPSKPGSRPGSPSKSPGKKEGKDGGGKKEGKGKGGKKDGKGKPKGPVPLPPPQLRSHGATLSEKEEAQVRGAHVVFKVSVKCVEFVCERYADT